MGNKQLKSELAEVESNLKSIIDNQAKEIKTLKEEFENYKLTTNEKITLLEKETAKKLDNLKSEILNSSKRTQEEIQQSTQSISESVSKKIEEIVEQVEKNLREQIVATRTDLQTRLTKLKQRQFPTISLKLLFIGMDNLGKQELWKRIGNDPKYEQKENSNPDEKIFENDEDDTLINILNLPSGTEEDRAKWEEYFPNCNGVVYVIDADDTEKLPDAKKELISIMENKHLENVPILIYTNKHDLDEEKNAQVKKGLALTGVSDDKTKRPVKLLLCSSKSGVNVKDGFEWLEQSCKKIELTKMKKRKM